MTTYTVEMSRGGVSVTMVLSAESYADAAAIARASVDGGEWVMTITPATPPMNGEAK